MRRPASYIQSDPPSKFLSYKSDHGVRDSAQHNTPNLATSLVVLLPGRLTFLTLISLIYRKLRSLTGPPVHCCCAVSLQRSSSRGPAIPRVSMRAISEISQFVKRLLYTLRAFADYNKSCISRTRHLARTARFKTLSIFLPL